MVALLATSTPAGQLALAKDAMAQLEYDAALQIARSVIADPHADPRALADANMLAGICGVILDDELTARVHFNAALRADAGARLPVEWRSSPKVASVFASVAEGHDTARDGVVDDAIWYGAWAGGGVLGAVVAYGAALNFQAAYRDSARSTPERGNARVGGLVSVGLAAVGVGIAAGSVYWGKDAFEAVILDSNGAPSTNAP